MKELLSYDDSNRRRSQSLCEYRPRINTELTIDLLNKLVSSQNLSLPTTGKIITPIESNENIPTTKRRTIFFICEPIISGFIIFPLLLIFWQSGWNFMIDWFNTFTDQHKAVIPSLYLSSQLIFLIIYMNQENVYNFLAKQEMKWLVMIILQFYTLITALNYIVQWVSMWTLWDHYTSDDWLVMLIISIAAILAIIGLTGHPCDLVCAPFIISYDSIEYNIRIDTPFITEKMNKYLSFILNYILYEYIISLLCILAWRGTYGLLDVYLYPNNENLSACVSLLIGYLLFFILMYTQLIENKMCLLPTFIHTNYPLFIQNIRHLCSFFSCVLLWRGFWILFDGHFATISFVNVSIYFVYIILMIVSFILLSLMKTASSLNGYMSHIDDEYNLFPLYSNCFLVKWFNKKIKSNEISSNSTNMTNIEPYTITLF